LELAAARYFGAESALYFCSGYAANLTLFATPSRGNVPTRCQLALDEVRFVEGKLESQVAS
jgi:7-keto-8-aminopelargonate synthetase-like enzyme